MNSTATVSIDGDTAKVAAMTDIVQEMNEKLCDTLRQARECITELRDEVSETGIRQTALHYAVMSHGKAPGKDSDACFVARARVFEAYLRGDDAARAALRTETSHDRH